MLFLLMSKHHLLAPLLTSQCFHPTQGTSRIDGIFLLCNYLNGDITVLPTQYCLSSINFRFGCYKMFLSWMIPVFYKHYWSSKVLVLPTQYFFSSSNFIFGCCKIFSSSHVASSLGRSFHCTKYSLIVLLLNILPLVFKTFSVISVICPSSSKGGSVFEMTISDQQIS